MERIDVLYRQRFPEARRRAKEKVWEVLCRHFFQRYVRETDVVLDLACGFGEFSRFIRAGRKILVDSNPDVGSELPAGAEFHVAAATQLDFLGDASVDVCFTSNFFEHLCSKQELDRVLAEVWRVLRPGGQLIALQPNIKHATRDYWDFYDHVLPLSHLSCAEGFRIAGFEVVELVGRFLPLTTTTRLPKHPWLVRAYLVLRPAWRVLGRQFLIVGRKPSGPRTADA